MHICSDINTVMLNLDVITSSPGLITFCYNLSVTDGIHRSSRRSCIVHTMMRTITLQHRMITAIGKTRRNTVEIKRSFQKCSFKTVSFLIIIKFLTILSERNSIICTVRSTERCRKHMKVLQRISIDIFLFVYHTEFIFLLKSEEVDSPSEYMRENYSQLRRSITILHGYPQ